MVVDGLGAATAVGKAASISIKLFQVVYEFKAVGQQTRDLLESTQHVSSILGSAQTMQQQKSPFLSSEERRWVDIVLVDTKRCLESVAALIEPARVDLQTRNGYVGLMNRGFFVFRDSSKVAPNIARLGLAHQSLSAVMSVLCSKGASLQPTGEPQATVPSTKNPTMTDRASRPEHSIQPPLGVLVAHTPVKVRSKGRAWLEARDAQWA
ncbi:hypothetical protein D6D02_04593 [Aureobasidium pullulans]|nr:hypothetical protein D6D18_10411 [Aureobasidium pullulans]THY13714.1 hypothetical protein D6D02_04593 [Aureobasidium pullulans]